MGRGHAFVGQPTPTLCSGHQEAAEGWGLSPPREGVPASQGAPWQDEEKGPWVCVSRPRSEPHRLGRLRGWENRGQIVNSRLKFSAWLTVTPPPIPTSPLSCQPTPFMSSLLKSPRQLASNSQEKRTGGTQERGRLLQSSDAGHQLVQSPVAVASNA